MIRGTTAPFKIKLPYAISELEWVTMKWWQDGNKGTTMAPLPITKKLADCSVSIYVCELLSEVVANELYYFVIDNINYGFTAPQNISAGNTLTFDKVKNIITAGEFDIQPTVIESVENMTALKFEKGVNQCKELYVSLTAEETMRFSDKHKAKMQLRAKRLADGYVFSCLPHSLTVYPINDELVEDDVVGPASDNGWVVLDGSEVGGDY